MSDRASVGMLARSSGASFRAGLSVRTDEGMEKYCVVFACDVLLVCTCHVHVDVLSAAVNALAGCCLMRSVFLCVNIRKQGAKRPTGAVSPRLPVSVERSALLAKCSALLII
jgi:hypothetical protein